MIVFPGIHLSIRKQIMILQSQEPLTTLSSSLVGGGFGKCRSIFNYHVDKNYRHPHPDQDLDQIAADWELPTPYIGMMTAASLEEAQISIQEADPLLVAAIVTAGLGNSTSAGCSRPASHPPPPGTINLILLINHLLSPAAMVNAVITATEAKTDLLQQNNIRTSGGEPATGTSTDAVVIAAVDQHPVIQFAGPATVTGWCIGKSVRQALGALIG